LKNCRAENHFAENFLQICRAFGAATSGRPNAISAVFSAADCLTKPRKRAWCQGGLIIIDNGQLGGELV
jgi:hypothetical protein